MIPYRYLVPVALIVTLLGAAVYYSAESLTDVLTELGMALASIWFIFEEMYVDECHEEDRLYAEYAASLEQHT